MKDVEYRDIAGYTGYRVGSDGSVWSKKTHGACGEWRQLKGTLLVPRGKNSGQSPRVVATLSNGATIRRFLVHVLVLEAFVGPKPEGMEGCHKDDDSTNNRVENLRWDTHRANMNDRDRNGGTARGTRIRQAKLTEKDIVAIRQLAHEGFSSAGLASLYSCSGTNICSIVSGQTWAHVGGPIRQRQMGEAKLCS